MPNDKSEKKEQARLTVVKQFRVSGKDIGTPTTTDETIDVRTFNAPHAQVNVEYGLTLNMGNYETARLTVGVSVPCYVEEIDDAHRFAAGWVEKRLSEQIDAVRSKKSSPF